MSDRPEILQLFSHDEGRRLGEPAGQSNTVNNYLRLLMNLMKVYSRLASTLCVVKLVLFREIPYSLKALKGKVSEMSDSMRHGYQQFFLPFTTFIYHLIRRLCFVLLSYQRNMFCHNKHRTVLVYEIKISVTLYNILDSIVVSIPACHAGDRGSIPRRGDTFE
jgi:hypothetical protein